MSVQYINIVTIDFPNPSLSPSGTVQAVPVRASDTLLQVVSKQQPNNNTLQLNQSFQWLIQENVQTLSSKNLDQGGTPVGLLFVPDLQTDGCKDQEKKYLASNVTRASNFPRDVVSYPLIAVAPWFSPPCMLEYFASARNEPVNAFIVYQPGESQEEPPAVNDFSWGLNDGGHWQWANTFPTFAIPPASGAVLATQLSLYSGNVSSVPYGDFLKQQYNETDYIRLRAEIGVDVGNSLPSLWVFLVIVLGLLIFVIGGTSGCMHVVQRRRRNNLRQRVINGEVDLEAIGVKRLTVPKDYLVKLPVYAYTGPSGDSEKDLNEPAIKTGSLSVTDVDKSMARSSSAPETPSEANRASAVFSQTTCAICLDDFEHNQSQVRELPCRHIYHVDCIDPFLLNNSSLCPICKQGVLPVGYCPAKITNLMVRRERLVNNRRAHQTAGEANQSSHVLRLFTRAASFLPGRTGGASSGRRDLGAPAEIEMASTSAAPTAPVAAVAGTTDSPAAIAAPEPIHGNASAACPQPPVTETSDRRQWTQQRALALLGDHHIPPDADEEEHTRSGWRRALRKMFPGFR